MSDDGSRLVVVMDQRTDGVGSVECGMLLLPADQGALGASATCRWDDNGQTLQVQLGRGASVVVGSAIDLLAGALKSLDTVSSGNLRQQVRIQAPQTVLPPR